MHIPVQNTYPKHIFYSFKSSSYLEKKLIIVLILGPAAAKLVQVVLVQTNEMQPCSKGYLPFHLILILGSATRQGHLQQLTNKHLALHFIPYPLFSDFRACPPCHQFFDASEIPTLAHG